MKTLRGIIRGKTIELFDESSFAEGQEVQVQLEPKPEILPGSQEAWECLKRAAGAWLDDVEGLDQYLVWNR